jgi:sarcosine oxidase
MAKTDYEYIVLGCGGIGSGATYWLSRRAGSEVLGLEQFELGHGNGGSQGYSRIIRLAGYGREDTPLTPHTYESWGAVEEESGLEIVTKTGGVFWWSKNAPGQFAEEMNQSAAAMEAEGIGFDRVDGEGVMRRYPQFCIDKDCEAIIQDDTGIADPSKGNAAHQQLARHHGATIIDNCVVEAIQPVGGGVRVVTGSGTFTCRRLVITAGAWVGRILAQLGLDLEVVDTQEQFTYYATPNLREFSVGRFPIFLTPTAMGEIYGFPVQGEVATKAAIDLSGKAVTADERTFSPDVEVEAFQETWLRRHVPGFLGPKLYTKTCLYTMPLDRQFILDTLPGHSQISLCVGAGQAFKFASLFGKILSELAIDGETRYSIDSMKWNRSGVTNRSDSPVLQWLESRDASH